MASLRELTSLGAGDWNYAGLDQDANPLHYSSRPRRRRSSPKRNTPDDVPPSSPQSSAPPQTPTAHTPPQSAPSSLTSLSANHDPSESESELSSVLDVSDWSDEKISPKKRKLDVPDARPRRTRKPTQKVLANRVAETNKKPRKRSATATVLKLDGKKLWQFDPSAASGEPASSSPPTAPAPESVQAQEKPASPLQSIAPVPESAQAREEQDQQLQEVPSSVFAAAPETYTPEDRDLEADPAFHVTPPRSSRKRPRPKKTDSSPASITAILSEDSGEDVAPDPIPEHLEHLVEVSRQLMEISGCPLDEKPPPVGQPEVWADARQALCESLPYFRAYQGAGYCTGGFAFSFMFDKQGCSRDYMDSEVVIARSGGGLSRDKGSGEMIRQNDQSSETSQVRSVKNNIDQYNPLVIISGDRNRQCPSRLPHFYNVLDWFKPTHVWAEKVDGKVNIRYRFEKLCLDKQSWWAPSGVPDPMSVDAQAPPHVHVCSHCEQMSQQVYLQGWMCLHSDCPLFWTLESGNEPQEAGLLYDPRFLKQHTPWPHANAPQPLRPNHLTLGPTPMLGDDVAWVAAKGLVCPQCGRCNPREAWEGWYCGNCDFVYSLPHATIPANALHDAYDPLSSYYTFSKDLCLPHIPLRVEFAHNYRINYFTIPGVDGFIAHFIANKTVNEEAGGPDDMWTELQTAQDLGLRRRPMASSTLRGPMLTQHFAVNYGMPYKFIASTASRPFSAAARPITATRSRLNWAARHCVGHDVHDKEFNELLALGYFERQKIDYHDDGERGLGPTIATLSVGAPAVMNIRMKAKHYHGMSKGGAYVNAAPMPGCEKYEERRVAHAELDRLKKLKEEKLKEGKPKQRKSVGEVDAYDKMLKTLPRQLGLNTAKNAKDAVTLHLRHGDIVVMHGAKIQEYYEHAVDPIGKLRFALTCRYIDPDSLKPADCPDYEVEPDAGDYDGSRLPAVSA
ncbi:hypothetical protein SLS58_011024 [Diplodia intermedia]|uniref:Alpha-ketoglutarate-dependent dioxygenase AlkB-like domain-containing protein n=1 Tax=Diplodia intermedia TaxID=856260 RepID=A0ABR3T2A4_9PEZI